MEIAVGEAGHEGLRPVVLQPGRYLPNAGESRHPGSPGALIGLQFCQPAGNLTLEESVGPAKVAEADGFGLDAGQMVDSASTADSPMRYLSDASPAWRSGRLTLGLNPSTSSIR